MKKKGEGAHGQVYTRSAAVAAAAAVASVRRARNSVQKLSVTVTTSVVTRAPEFPLFSVGHIFNFLTLLLLL